MNLQRSRRLSGSTAILALMAFAQPQAAIAQAQSYEFNIPAQNLENALRSFARTTRQQVVFRGPLVRGKRSSALVGQFGARAGLEQMLQGTGLSIDVSPRGVLVVVTGKGVPGMPGESAGNEAAPVAAPEAETDIPESDIVVTAQKREQRLRDVPVPVSVVNTARLAETNQLRLEDFYAKVPGLNLTLVEPFGSATIAVRGLITGLYQSPTVGITVDDVPYTSSTTVGFGNAVPDMDPSDLARIEILRGPQGTLYGASSMGGLLKYATIDPSTDGVSGRIQAGLSGIHNGSRLGYTVRGAVNLPLGEDLAVRASGFTRLDPGYLDDPTHGIEGVNRGVASGGRLTALWHASEAVSVRLGALYQTTNVRGTASANIGAGFGDLEQNTPPRSGGFRKEIQIYNANITARIGKADLASISAYSIVKNLFRGDYTPLFGNFANANFPGVTGSTSIQDVKATKFTQELRLTTPIGDNVEWLIGAFYNHENVPRNFQQVFATDFTTGARAAEIAHLTYLNTFDEYAVFTDLTVHFGERFDVQVGGRQSHSSQDYFNSGGGLLFGGSFAQPEAHSKSNAFTYLLTPRFRISNQVMTYARFASGYRPGGPNGGVALNSSLPTEYGPDKTMSYEIGVKGSTIDRTLSFDLSLYHIDWRDIQLQLQDPVSFLTYYDNGGEAKSQGVEVSLEARPARGLTIAGSFSYNNAELTEDLPTTAANAIGFAGDRLPFGARFSSHLSVDQEFTLGLGLDGFVGAEMSHVGSRKDVFSTAAQRDTFPAYTTFDFRAGLKKDGWVGSIYATNITDRRGILGKGFSIDTVNYIRPRSFGLSVAKSF